MSGFFAVILVHWRMLEYRMYCSGALLYQSWWVSMWLDYYRKDNAQCVPMNR